MSDVLNDVVDAIETNDARREAGLRASRKGGVVRIVARGYALVIVTWIGGDAFVVTSQVGANDWRAIEVTRDEVSVMIEFMFD